MGTRILHSCVNVAIYKCIVFFPHTIPEKPSGLTDHMQQREQDICHKGHEDERLKRKEKQRETSSLLESCCCGLLKEMSVSAAIGSTQKHERYKKPQHLTRWGEPVIRGSDDLLQEDL